MSTSKTSRATKPRSPGRPPSAEGREKFTTTLPPGYPERLRAIGDGNASAAIIKLVNEYERRRSKR